MYNWAERAVMTDKSLRSSSVSVSAAIKQFRGETELISYEAVNINPYPTNVENRVSS